MTNIKKRLITLVVSLVVTVAVIMTAVGTLAVYFVLKSNSNDESQGLAHAYALAIQTAGSDLKAQMELVASNDILTNPDSTTEEKLAYLDAKTKSSGFLDYAIADPDGQTTNDTDISDREYFQQALKGKTYISSPVLRKTDGNIIIMAATPLSDGNILYGAISADYFSSIVGESTFRESGKAYVLDNTGTVVADKDFDNVEEFYNGITAAEKNEKLDDYAALIKKMIAGKTGTEVIRIDGERTLISYEPLGNDEGWSVAVSVPYNEIIISSYESLAIMIVILILFDAIAVLVGRRFAIKISRPIVGVSERLDNLAQGDLRTAAPMYASGDETQKLAEALSSTIHSINTYIGDIDSVLGKIAQGDLTVQSQQEYAGDFAAIKVSLNTILDSLNNIFIEIHISAQQVNVGAQQVSEGASVLSRNATEESATIEELSAQIAAITDSITKNAENAKTAKELAIKTVKDSEGGKQSMNQMLDAMDGISRSSEQIKRINNVIDDIAFQTNILALNAAVEAARAGAAGKGFAVVADEVRSLAAKSAEAAKDTNQLVGESLEAVELGKARATETSAALIEIIEMINRVTGLMKDISEASDSQAVAAEQIDIGMGQITATVQTTSATAQESAAAAQELSGQASVLMERISEMKLRGQR